MQPGKENGFTPEKEIIRVLKLHLERVNLQ